MLVKIIDAESVQGGKAIALCDDSGEMLPMQTDVVVENGVGRVSTITVTFSIDGEKVRFAD